MRRFYVGLASSLFALALLVGVSTGQKAEAAVTYIETETFSYNPGFELGAFSFSIPVSGLYEFTFEVLSGSGFSAFGLQVVAEDSPPLPAGFEVASTANTFSFESLLIGPDIGGGPADYQVLFGGAGATAGGQYSLTVELVSAVPESSTWAMMIAGLGLLGWRANAVRRRQRLNAQALAA